MNERTNCVKFTKEFKNDAIRVVCILLWGIYLQWNLR